MGTINRVSRITGNTNIIKKGLCASQSCDNVGRTLHSCRHTQTVTKALVQHNKHSCSFSRLHFTVNMWKRIECHLSGVWGSRHYSSREGRDNLIWNSPHTKCAPKSDLFCTLVNSQHWNLTHPLTLCTEHSQNYVSLAPGK